MGEQAGHFLSVTVTGPNLALADAYATTVFVMGEQGLDWVSQFADYSVLPVRGG
ncbi:MAG: FAD:protein FMN transferase [Actinomycetota bacterium]